MGQHPLYAQGRNIMVPAAADNLQQQTDSSSKTVETGGPNMHQTSTCPFTRLSAQKLREGKE